MIKHNRVYRKDGFYNLVAPQLTTLSEGQVQSSVEDDTLASGIKYPPITYGPAIPAVKEPIPVQAVPSRDPVVTNPLVGVINSDPLIKPSDSTATIGLPEGAIVTITPPTQADLPSSVKSTSAGGGTDNNGATSITKTAAKKNNWWLAGATVLIGIAIYKTSKQ